MALETEIAYYNELLPELLQSSAGKFVAIKNNDLVGVFEERSLSPLTVPMMAQTFLVAKGQ